MRRTRASSWLAPSFRYRGSRFHQAPIQRDVRTEAPTSLLGDLSGRNASEIVVERVRGLKSDVHNLIPPGSVSPCETNGADRLGPRDLPQEDVRSHHVGKCVIVGMCDGVGGPTFVAIQQIVQ